MTKAPAMTPQPAIIAQGVSHRYGDRPVLSDVNVSLAAGEIIGLLGPNGSGKSTLFRILSTLIPLQAGSVTVLGHDLAADASAVRRLIGVSFQSPALDVRLTVRENLTCHAAIYGLPRAETRSRIDELLAQFSLTDRVNDVVGTLSGGFRRRVEIVKALLHGPAILLLDEPTVGLDPGARREFWRALQRCRSEAGTSVVVATHLMDEAEYCDQLVLLYSGRVSVTGTPHDLRASLGHEQLRVRGADIASVRNDLEAVTGVRADVHGDALTFKLDNPAGIVGQLTSQFGERIRSIEIARPTLEDVFLSRTGHSLTEQEEAA